MALPDDEQTGHRGDAEHDDRAETPAQRRRRLAAVFGDVLPDATADERDPEDGREGGAEAWLREQVPPHHG
jgi:hypothetical protein